MHTSQETPEIACEPQEAKKRHRRTPYRFHREHGSNESLISDFVQNGWTTNFCCFKTPGLWHFVMEALGSTHK